VNARFYVPGVYKPGDAVDLPDDEAQHLTRVLRLRSGDFVRIFDGRGLEFDATVEGASKSAATVRVGNRRAANPEPRISITLAHAVLKGDRMDDVVRDAVMVGVAAIQPIVTSRTEVALTAIDRGRRRERWARVAVSSAKQSGRAVIPPVLEPVPFELMIRGLGQVTLPQPALMLVEPSAECDALTLSDLDPSAPREGTIVIGPEGGWTPEEIESASAVCRVVRLGGRTIRADAMGLVATAALFARWGEF
jgi:16S rRNA (uracil1498-N3)-methyltransferase